MRFHALTFLYRTLVVILLLAGVHYLESIHKLLRVQTLMMLQAAGAQEAEPPPRPRDSSTVARQ